MILQKDFINKFEREVKLNVDDTSDDNIQSISGMYIKKANYI